MSLYQFTELKRFVMREFGVDPDAITSTFERITERLTREELGKRVKLSNSAIIYTDDEGNEHKGFLYIAKGYSRPYPDKDTGDLTIVPRFHTCNCETIAEQIRRSNYDGHYVFSEKREEVKEFDGTMKDPRLCSRCHAIMSHLQKRMTTAQYEEILIHESERAGRFRSADLPNHIDVLESGYTANWDEKSKAYRLKRKFTCEDCGIQLNKRYTDGYYLETHHISGVKTDNRDVNLKCLCVLCHAYVNDEHRRNYSKGPNSAKLNDFLNLFRDELTRVGNRHL